MRGPHDAAGPIEVLSQLIADEITLLSTGMQVTPVSDGPSGRIGNALDEVMALLEHQLGSRIAAQRWVLSPRTEFADRTAGELIARGAQQAVLEAARRARA
jgi:hypothetical protein